MSSSISRQISVKAKLAVLLLLDADGRDGILKRAANSEWKYAGRLARCFSVKYGLEPLTGATSEALSLAVNNAEVLGFVERLFLSNEPLYIPGVRPSAELIPTVVQAFKEKSSAHQLHFRHLDLRFTDQPLSYRFYDLWPDAADRRLRPCPYCSSPTNENDIDCYHFVNDRDGLRLTVELTYRWAQWTRWDGRHEQLSYTVSSVRIFTERGRHCSRPRPQGPKRKLVFLRQPDILEEVFRFSGRDDLDSFQLTCRQLRKFVDARADAFALRPLSEVVISSDNAPAELFVQIKTESSLKDRGRVFAGNNSQSSMETALSLLRNGCALMLKYRPGRVPVLQALLVEGVRFVSKAAELRCFHGSDLESLAESLQLLSTIGMREFHFLMHEFRYMRLLTSEALAGADFVSCRLIVRRADLPTLTEGQQLVDDLLRMCPGKRVAFRMPHEYPVVRADRIIEQFIEAERPVKFTMPLSIQFECWHDDFSVPAQCRYPTLQSVAIPANVLVRHYAWQTTRFDVYHFRNARTTEHLTACLGKRDDGSVGFIFIQQGRVFQSEEDIASMEPFPFALTN